MTLTEQNYIHEKIKSRKYKGNLSNHLIQKRDGSCCVSIPTSPSELTFLSLSFGVGPVKVRAVNDFILRRISKGGITGMSFF